MAPYKDQADEVNYYRARIETTSETNREQVEVKMNSLIYLVNDHQFIAIFYQMLHVRKQICDMIKRNESDVGDISFEILQKQCSNSFVLCCF